MVNNMIYLFLVSRMFSFSYQSCQNRWFSSTPRWKNPTLTTKTGVWQNVQHILNLQPSERESSPAASWELSEWWRVLSRGPGVKASFIMLPPWFVWPSENVGDKCDLPSMVVAMDLTIYDDLFASWILLTDWAMFKSIAGLKLAFWIVLSWHSSFYSKVFSN